MAGAGGFEPPDGGIKLLTRVSTAKKGLAFCSKKSVCVHASPGVAAARTGAPLAPASRRSGARVSEGLDWPSPIKDTKGTSMSIKLTYSQLVMLSEAAQREDRCLIATPALKGGAGRQ